MSSIKFNTLVISTNEGEILDVIVGTDIGILSQLIETQHWDTMLEEALAEDLNINEVFGVQNLSEFYKINKHNNSLVVRVTYFPDKIVFHK